MSDQDTSAGGPPDDPRDITPSELDEALRWLEELAGKQGKSIDGLVSLEETSLEDSPFKGLFDGDQEDLPDWLREVPSLSETGEEIVEGESRLDWLARMANRESVEELPTLEWRRLSEDEELDDLVEALPGTAEAIAGLPDASALVAKEPDVSQSEPAVAAQVEYAPETNEAADVVSAEATAPVQEDDPPAVVDLMVAMAAAEAAEAESAESSAPETGVAPAGDASEQPAAKGRSEPKPEATAPQPVAAGPAPEDLDEAMAWLEELAASQDAPIEDLPSVADRALASKLIAEAASGVSQGDGLDISQLGIAMSGIYVGQTRQAPTGPLVGEGPADETPDSAIHAEIALAHDTEGYAGEGEPPVALAAAESYAADVLLAAGMAAAVESAGEVDQPIEDVAEFDVASSPLEPVVQESEDEVAPVVAVTARPVTLPELLLAVDRIAVPRDTSLTEISAMFAADQTLVRITPFSLESTLEWLEGGPTNAADPLDPALVAAMPEDPDEAQAWLENMAGIEMTEVASVSDAAVLADAAAALDLTEADLLDMPEDPDAAIAWIESLAARRDRSG